MLRVHLSNNINPEFNEWLNNNLVHYRGYRKGGTDLVIETEEKRHYVYFISVTNCGLTNSFDLKDCIEQFYKWSRPIEFRKRTIFNKDERK